MDLEGGAPLSHRARLLSSLVCLRHTSVNVDTLVMLMKQGFAQDSAQRAVSQAGRRQGTMEQFHSEGQSTASL